MGGATIVEVKGTSLLSCIIVLGIHIEIVESMHEENSIVENYWYY